MGKIEKRLTKFIDYWNGLTEELKDSGFKNRESNKQYYLNIIGFFSAIVGYFILGIKAGIAGWASLFIVILLLSLYFFIVGYILISQKKYKDLDSVTRHDKYSLKEKITISFNYMISSLFFISFLILFFLFHGIFGEKPN